MINKTFDKRNETKIKDKVNSVVIWNCNIKSTKLADIFELFNGSKTIETIQICQNQKPLKTDVVLSLGEMIKSIKIHK